MSFRNFIIVASVFVGLGAATASAAAQIGTSNIRLYSEVSPQRLGSRTANDIWGYVSPSGREYAIIGARRTMAVIEVTDPVNPVIVHVEPHLPSGSGDFKVYQHYAYGLGDKFNLHILDLSAVDDGVVTLAGEEHIFGHNLFINEESGYMYVFNLFDNPRPGTRIYDLSDPVNPEFVAYINPSDAQAHDAQVVNYHDGPYAGREIMYLHIADLGLDIIDVTDKQNVTLLANITYPGIGFCHQGWLDEDRNYYYVDDAFDEMMGRSPMTRTLVFDVRDPANPFLASSFTTGLRASDHNLFWHEGFVYEANWASGLWIFDARIDPLNPDIVGWYDTYPLDDEDGIFHGAMAPYPFFPSGNIILSDWQRGLLVFDATEARGERFGLDVGPLIRGEACQITAIDAKPGETIYFLYSGFGQEGWTWIDEVGGYASLQNAVVADTAVTDSNGSASVSPIVPPRAQAGRPVWLQAIQVGKSSLVVEAIVE
ncbi:MAG: choice-of-anchor B family protein [Phycisphaerales bacterium]